jgi:PhzF family phenazine biosynthesis protein
VNAFVANGKGGNPAGIVVNASKLTDSQMQYIARKVGAAETAFVLHDERATHRFRFFTPTMEVPLCGHATIASWFFLLNHNLHDAGDYTQDTLAGLVHISVNENGLIFMEQPQQVFEESLEITVISKALNIPEADINSSFKPQIVQDNLMLALKLKEILNTLELSRERVIQLGQKYGFGTLHVFVLLDNSNAVAAVRNFAPAEGIDEDVATGTTNGSFLTYLKHCNILPDLPVYKIEQGEALGNLSYVYGKFQNGRVWIGGESAETGHVKVKLN